ncbi:MAG: alpha-L-fucosidase [Kiritimatiellae bacterium]|nr:alpha-L-fucosidase [Kiritimatiellia bacterium]
MKNTSVFASAVAFASLVASASPTLSRPEDVAKLIPQETAGETASRMAWWTDSRFGMFIHFGLYAMPARHEWVKTYERIPEDRYRVYFDNFNPDLFDAREWARSAKEAGMKYVVLTAKHHEGFCLWDTAATDYKITNTPFGRDLVKEYVEALRAEGLKVGLYYSLIDWHHPDFTVDQHHPLRGDESDETYARLNKGRDMARYRKFLVDQVTELLTQYGKIDIIWFDFSYPGKHGKSRDDWDSPALLALARKLQPGIIVDNRMDMNDVPGGCDFLSPEQFKVTAWPLLNGKRFPWETCQTFSGSWGYHRDESTWKSPKQCLQLLIDAVAHGGNLIMNVGPTGRGEFDARAKARLEEFGKWMHWNSRAIYGCTEAPAEFETPDGCVMTWNPKTRRLYLHVYSYPSSGAIGLRFADRVEYAQFLHDGSEIPVKGLPDWQKATDPGACTTFCMMPVTPPDVAIPVIELFIK